MWIMILVLVNLTTHEEKTWVAPDPIQYTSEHECMSSWDREPVLWNGYEMKVRCVQLGMDG